MKRMRSDSQNAQVFSRIGYESTSPFGAVSPTSIIIRCSAPDLSSASAVMIFPARPPYLRIGGVLNQIGVGTTAWVPGP